MGKSGRHSVIQLIQDCSKFYNPRKIAKVLNKHFISVITVPTSKLPTACILKSMLAINITKVETCLKNINTKKSTGPYGVPLLLLTKICLVPSHPTFLKAPKFQIYCEIGRMFTSHLFTKKTKEMRPSANSIWMVLGAPLTDQMSNNKLYRECVSIPVLGL